MWGGFGDAGISAWYSFPKDIREFEAQSPKAAVAQGHFFALNLPTASQNSRLLPAQDAPEQGTVIKTTGIAARAAVASVWG
jgi:hypothetical protein